MAEHSLEWVECKSCETKFTLKESLQSHLIEVNGKQWKHSRKASDDQVNGCDVEKVKLSRAEFAMEELRRALEDPDEGRELILSCPP